VTSTCVALRVCIIFSFKEASVIDWAAIVCCVGFQARSKVLPGVPCDLNFDELTPTVAAAPPKIGGVHMGVIKR
jgi:hypothetical protein